MGVVKSSFAVIICIVVGALAKGVFAQADEAFTRVRSTQLSHNATSCIACHAVPIEAGSSKVVVKRAVLAPLQANAKTGAVSSQTTARVTPNALGDAYVEAVPPRELQAIASAQPLKSFGRIHGSTNWVSLPEAASGGKVIGRFGWKAQHGSLVSASADALADELGIPNRLFPIGHRDKLTTTPSIDGDGEVEAIVRFLRSSEPVAPSLEQGATKSAKAGSKIFDQIGCSLCHVRPLKTAPTGTRLNGGTLIVSERLGSKAFHPFGDYLLHDVGTGDGVAQSLRAEDYDPSTANKFRTAPLWGIRFRSWLMHDGQSVTYHQAIMRHSGEAAEVVQKYMRLTPVEKEQLREFLNSL